jgi:type II secretory pathway component PulF
MNNDEFAFFNQQLAAMLRDGIPLEAALRRLCADMRRGSLRSELQKVEAALAQGVPLPQALAARQLPDLYRQMLEVGAQSNNLPAVLTMLADHFRRRHLVWTKLKGLMVYPVMVLIGALALSCFLALLMSHLIEILSPGIFPGLMVQPFAFALWAGPILIGMAAVAVLTAFSIRKLRQQLRWRFSAFRDASLAQAASAMALMLKSGVSLDKALGLMENLEGDSPAGPEFARWRQRLAAGQAKFSDIAGGGKVFPPFFVWAVSQAQEDLSAGFQCAAEMYQSRATQRTELLLYSALPCSILVLGLLIVSQLQPVIAAFTVIFRASTDY